MSKHKTAPWVVDHWYPFSFPLLVLLAALAASVSSPEAGSNSAALGVSVTVVRRCSVSATPLAFGNYDPVTANATTNLQASASVTVVCTKGSNPTVGLSAGSNAPGPVALRAMASEGNKLSYEIAKDAAFTQAWSDSGSELYKIGTVSSLNPINIPVHGRIPAGQNVPEGNYTDSVTVTVNF